MAPKTRFLHQNPNAESSNDVTPLVTSYLSEAENERDACPNNHHHPPTTIDQLERGHEYLPEQLANMKRTYSIEQQNHMTCKTTTQCPSSNANRDPASDPCLPVGINQKLQPEYHCHEHKSPTLRWIKRLYRLYEAAIITAALIVFMVSSVPAYRVPIQTGFQVDSSKVDSRNNNSPFTQQSTSNQIPGANLTMPNKQLLQMDIFFSAAISLDVLIRFICCPAWKHWILSIYNIVDIVSLIPFYCETIMYQLALCESFQNTESVLIILTHVEKYVVALKVFIVLRLFRVLRRHRGTRVLLYTIWTTIKNQLILTVLYLQTALFYGAAIFFIDDNFTDIAKGTWWAVITMSTVGYGDLIPSTVIGYMIATSSIISGALLMSYTIPIMVNNYIHYYNHADQLKMVKQLHRTARRKAQTRTVSKYAQKALSSAKDLVNATITNAVARVSSNIPNTRGNGTESEH